MSLRISPRIPPLSIYAFNVWFSLCSSKPPLAQIERRLPGDYSPRSFLPTVRSSNQSSMALHIPSSLFYKPEFSSPADNLRNYRASLPFKFNRKIAMHIRTSCLFQSPTRPRKVFAYLDGGWLWEHRYALLRKRRVESGEAYRKTMTFSELDFDPYYAGLLIAMAQYSRQSNISDTIEVRSFSYFRGTMFLSYVADQLATFFY